MFMTYTWTFYIRGGSYKGSAKIIGQNKYLYYYI